MRLSRSATGAARNSPGLHFALVTRLRWRPSVPAGMTATSLARSSGHADHQRQSRRPRGDTSTSCRRTSGTPWSQARWSSDGLASPHTTRNRDSDVRMAFCGLGRGCRFVPGWCCSYDLAAATKSRAAQRLPGDAPSFGRPGSCSAPPGNRSFRSAGVRRSIIVRIAGYPGAVRATEADSQHQCGNRVCSSLTPVPNMRNG